MSQSPPAQTTTPPPDTQAASWKDADRAARRGLIVDAALDLLHREGLAAVTARRVASAVGVGAMTLYTYVDGQDDLHRAMVAHGFAMIHENCCRASESKRVGEDDWWPGARAYVDFAVTNPNLYRLMFDTPVAPDDAAFDQVIHGGFQPLIDRVRERLAAKGLSGKQLDTEARRTAGRHWIALHGLATLAIAGRMQVLHGKLDDVLRHLIEATAPTKG